MNCQTIEGNSNRHNVKKNVCRLCVKCGNATRNIFEVHNDESGVNKLKFTDKLKICLGLKVEMIDGLPNKVCETCYNKVTMFCDFREQCRLNDINLRKNLNGVCLPQQTPEITRMRDCFHTDSILVTTSNLVLKDETVSDSSGCEEFPSVDGSPLQPSHCSQGIETEWSMDTIETEMTKTQSPVSSQLKNIEADWVEVCHGKSPTHHHEGTGEDSEKPWRFRMETSFENSFQDISFSDELHGDTEVDDVNAKQCHFETGKGSEICFLDVTPSEECTSVAKDDNLNLEAVSNASTCSTQNMQTDPSIDLCAGKISQNNKGFWICNICRKKTKRFGVLKRHVLEHFSYQGLTCTECKVSFSSQRALDHHLKKHNLNSCSLGYTCNDCGKIYQLKHLLKKHIALEHDSSRSRMLREDMRSKEFNVSCGLCIRVFHSSIEMEEHFESCAEEGRDCLSDSSDGTQHADSSQLKDNFNSQVTDAHFEKDAKDTVMKKRNVMICHQCHLRFHTTKALVFHMKKDHNCDTPFQCKVVGCGRFFATRQRYRLHERNHYRTRAHECSLCSAKFRDKHDLDDHMNSHNNVRPFECDFCGKAYMRKQHLREHISIHLDGKKFNCKECGKKFHFAKHLQEHEAVHSSEARFVCEVCGNRFKRKMNLSKHCKLYHTAS